MKRVETLALMVAILIVLYTAFVWYVWREANDIDCGYAIDATTFEHIDMCPEFVDLWFTFPARVYAHLF